MISRNEIEGIILVYTKHGWDLSRVLISSALSETLGSKAKKDLFDEVEIELADFDAVWFERDRDDGGIAWEIRELSGQPFALCESFFGDTPPEEIITQKEIMENRLRERASKRQDT